MSGAPRPALRRVARAVIGRAARRYIAGERIEGARAIAARAARCGVPCTLGYWDEGTEPASDVLRAYSEAASELAGLDAGGTLSVKGPALALESGLVAALAAHCDRQGVPLHFDSLAATDADAILDLALEAARAGGPVGVTLPSRWHRSARDVERAVPFAANVRVVKGQWADPGGDGPDPHANFLALIDRLAGGARHVAVATHDSELAAEALRRLARAGTPHELELLFGLPLEGPARVARAAGTGVRLYVPYGHGWLPYAGSQALRRPRVLLWLLRDLVTSGGTDSVERLCSGLGSDRAAAARRRG